MSGSSRCTDKRWSAIFSFGGSRFPLAAEAARFNHARTLCISHT
ncbi:hypothetical protein PCI56_12210 [Plesiomonas shigelloides subsp. oncorhynchi]|nr:hypothetical protein [Plesiomonas shigelloides]